MVETEIPSIPALEVPVEEVLSILDELKLLFLQSTVTTTHHLESILSPLLRGNSKSRIDSGCEIIFRSILKEFGRVNSEEPRHDCPMFALARHCQEIRQRWLEGPQKIQRYLQPFLQRAHTVLIHGHSTVICDSLLHAFEARGTKFIFTEGSPLLTGRRSMEYVIARWEDKMGNREIEKTLSIIPDSAVAATIPMVSFILVPATAVTISGGAVGMVGGHQIALLAHALGKDFYTVAEVFRFSRIFPLTSKDIECVQEHPALNGYVHDPKFPLVEYIPPNLIIMYFTNIGLFPPATASDELYNIFLGDSSGKNPLLE